jgi:hypothetical protein
MPAGGRGYTRPASLISLWSTAPFLQNNSIGHFEASPSVEARMRSFQDSIEQMLWPEKRKKDDVLGDKVPGFIDRTVDSSHVSIPGGYLPGPPGLVASSLDFLHRLAPAIFGDGGITIGPIPKGTPVNLLANIELVSENPDPKVRAQHNKDLFEFVNALLKDLKKLGDKPSDDEARKAFVNLVGPMLKLSKCPDFVVNRGHYFGTDRFKEQPGLSDEDKYALIEFLKTL